ncbi:collagen-like protein [Nocardioides sp. LMS-CY]|uniref:collagen-like protein n=1 Tax=Nocardioides sp. (strain LMS-CY) TaxID=2840457 RepID=UPI001C004D6D|nr:collagen-like protein [Nocardioides sp. LMS-CY]QWF22603.1 collagen-like protein [Nocardioides sp. LMS-CY]
MKRIDRAFGPAALVLAILALVVATGMTSAYAAAKITTKQLAKNAVTSPKIKDGTIKVRDLAPGTVASLRGSAGPEGRDGAAGPVGPSGGTGPAGQQGQPGRDGRDAVAIWASVDAFGDLVHHAPEVVAADWHTNGTFSVEFGRDISNCALAATLNGSDFAQPRTIWADAETATSAMVRTYGYGVQGGVGTWALSSFPFTITAYCPS